MLSLRVQARKKKLRQNLQYHYHRQRKTYPQRNHFCVWTAAKNPKVWNLSTFPLLPFLLFQSLLIHFLELPSLQVLLSQNKPTNTTTTKQANPTKLTATATLTPPTQTQTTTPPTPTQTTPKQNVRQFSSPDMGITRSQQKSIISVQEEELNRLLDFDRDEGMQWVKGERWGWEVKG